MKKLREILGEMQWQNLPKADDSDIIDLRKQKTKVKIGQPWDDHLHSRMGKVVTQKQADSINSGEMKGGSPFPDSWDKTKIAKSDLQKPQVVASGKGNPSEPESGITAWLKKNTSNKPAPPIPTPRPPREAAAATQKQNYMTSVRPNDALSPDELRKPQRNWTTKELDNMFK